MYILNEAQKKRVKEISKSLFHEAASIEGMSDQVDHFKTEDKLDEAMFNINQAIEILTTLTND